jgi:transposase
MYVGIDVSKARLDVALQPTKVTWSVPNDSAGIDQLVEKFLTLRPELIVMEATGGLERPLCITLNTTPLKVHVANPKHVRDFAKGEWGDWPKRIASTP